MHGLVLAVAAATLGVDYGYQPLPDGQLEYIIQIEPDLVGSLKNGEHVTSELLPEVRGVRRFRVQIGTGPLPREGAMPASAGADARAALKLSPDAAAAQAASPTESAPTESAPTETSRHAAATDFAVRHTTHKIPADVAGRVRDDHRGEDPGDGRAAPPKSPKSMPSVGEPQRASDDSTPPEAPVAPKPWAWLTVALVGLFASLGANAYLSWIAVSIRRRYLDLVEHAYNRPATPAEGAPS